LIPPLLHKQYNKMSFQDWSTVVIKGKSNTPGPSKVTAKVAPEVIRMRKVEESETVKTKTLAPESRQEIVQKRVVNKWSQTDLNNQCCFPINTIREIEAGRITPSSNQLNTLNRVLKAGLKLI
jgi:ribosome-binding protein aMBF1 (putative translation factor)